MAKLLLIAGLVFVFCLPTLQSAEIQGTFRRQILSTTGSSHWEVVDTQEPLEMSSTAFVIFGMLNTHTCPSAAARVRAMAPEVNRVANAARALGATIIHVPSHCIDFYQNYAQRMWVLNLTNVDFSAVRQMPLLRVPVDPDQGVYRGCDVGPPYNSEPPTHQIELIDIQPNDAIVDSNEAQLWNNVLQARRIKTVLFSGAHLNYALLYDACGLANTYNWGFSPILVRDLTDTFCNAAGWPYVTHEQGHALMLAYIEKYVVPTMSSLDILAQQ